jgi:hypothetical protein
MQVTKQCLAAVVYCGILWRMADSGGSADSNRERLNRHMEDRRYELGMRTWRALSDRAGIAYETLRALRAGSNPSDATVRDLETALRWERGSIDAILAGGEPTPRVERHVGLRDSARAEDDLADRPPTRQELEEITAEIRRLRKELDDVKAQQAERSTSQVRRDLDMG